MGTRVLTFAELDVLANRLAHRLIACRVRRASAVGVLTERSLERVIAVLAVVKAGAAYVPLDNRLPPARMRWMLAETNARAVVTDQTIDPASLTVDTPVVEVKLEELINSEGEARQPNVPLYPDDLAYIMYTSGSTGRPKGVAVSHHAVLEFVRDRCWRDEAQLRVLLHTPLGFDLSTYELWVPLLRAGQIFVAPPGEIDVTTLERLVKEHGITSLFLTTALFNLVAEEQPRCLAGVCEVWIGGERASSLAIQQMWDACPLVTVMNGYGPTEATTFVTYHQIRARPTDSMVSIGKPMDNTQLYVLDDQLRKVAPGIHGELYIASSGLAQGYFGRPGLTAERFVTNPFGPPGSLMYRTGDVAAWDHDGNLAFIGRVDDQIKIRGLRVELGEIEAALREHPAVGQAAVIAHERSSGELQLVGYVVGTDTALPDSSADERHVERWRQLYDALHTESCPLSLGSDFSVWKSSYDGQPIPIEHMRDWTEATAERIRALSPRRVLEIGVGTGLLLAELAPHAEEYWGTDFSAPVIEALRAELSLNRELAKRVVLRTQPATDIEGLPQGHFDVVIINSVVQYFPSLPYLIAVLDKALILTAPGGTLFVGDVRDLVQLRTVHTEVQLQRSERDVDPMHIRSAIEHAVSSTEELLLAPDFFFRLAQDRPEIGGVDLRVKGGRLRNEMSRYRYDVAMRKIPCTSFLSVSDLPELRWGRELHPASLEELSNFLERFRGTGLRLIGAPNGRIAHAAQAVRLLKSGEAEAARDCVLNPMLHPELESVPDPQAYCEVGARLGWRVLVTWSSEVRDGSLDVLFIDSRSPEFADGAYIPSGGDDAQSLAACANAPASSRKSGELVVSVRAFLSARLPDYMIPTSIVPLDALPLSLNGKVDRRALPKPGTSLARRGRGPRTETEEQLCALFGEILGVSGVSIDDDFFALGGHSLAAMRLRSRIRAMLSAEISVRALFETPTVAGLVGLLEEPTLPRLVPAPRPVAVPMSFAQRRLWFLDSLDTSGPGGHSCNYNVPLAIRITGPLDRPALAAALEDVIERHETLRTVFREIEGSVCQVVINPSSSQSHQIVLHPIETNEAELPELLRAEGRTGFDLQTHCPIRAQLYVLAPTEHVLLLVIHHIAYDGWSLAPLVKDLSRAYTARRDSRTPDFRPLPASYADYTRWQLEWLGETDHPGSLAARQLAYWTETLAGLPELVSLPTDWPRPPRASQQGDQVHFELSPEVYLGLKKIARERGATLFMVLHAGLAALLTRLGAGTDVPIGTPVAGRNDDALQDLIGFFVNTIVLRTDTSGDPQFVDLLKQVREVNLAAYVHQDLPFERLVEKLEPKRSLAHNPLFEIMLAVQGHPIGFELAGLDVETRQIPIGTCRFDLVMNLLEPRDHEDVSWGITELVEYRSGLYERSTIEAFCARYVRLIESVIRDPERRLSAIDLLTDKERHRILAAGGGGTQPIEPRTVPSLFAEQVAKTPNGTAVEFEACTVSYRALDQRVNQLARVLIERGIGHEHIVAIDLPRSIEWVAAILAVLKAGAAYLPLNPSDPAARRRLVLENANPRLLIATTETASNAADDKVSQYIINSPAAIGDLAARRDVEVADQERSRPIGSDDAAYIIYTSGSTGQPKGVVVAHSGFAGLRTAQLEHFDVTPGSRILQFASPSFDGAVWEVFGALLTGATLVISRPEEIRPGPELEDTIDRLAITHITLPPAVLEVMDDTSLSSVKALIVSGEASSGTLVRRWSVGRRLINGYGPTEATVCATLSRPLSGDDAPPIGRPIDSVRCYVLGPHLELVPPGVIGELYLAGLGIARGYLNQPGLTAERFVANPHGSAGDRMYRTGDLVRWRGDELEFVGRADNQIKTRGFRIEAGEIEAALLRYGGVAQAAAVLRADQRGNKRLVAYVVLESQNGDIEPWILREHLTRELPSYLVPAAIMILAALPLTVNGKLNHQALPEPEFRLAMDVRAPRTQIERALCALFAEVLDTPVASVDANFFDLGGHSLLATQLVKSIRDEFDVKNSCPARV